VTYFVLAAMRRQGLNAPYLSTRTKITKVYKLSATTTPLLLHRCCYSQFLNLIIMERSIFKVVNDFFIGKKIEFFIEARHIDGRVSRIHETEGRTKEQTTRKTEYGEYQYIDEKIIDKIIQVEIKGHNWIFHTLEGYKLKRRHFEDVKIVEAAL
jgi:hypothetical protein